MQELHQQLADQTQRLDGLTSGDATSTVRDQQQTLTNLHAKHLAAQVAAALAKTEENPGGGRLPSTAGRERARQLAEAALAASPDSPDAHFGMGDVLMDARQAASRGRGIPESVSSADPNSEFGTCQARQHLAV